MPCRRIPSTHTIATLPPCNSGRCYAMLTFQADSVHPGAFVGRFQTLSVAPRRFRSPSRSEASDVRIPPRRRRGCGVSAAERGTTATERRTVSGRAPPLPQLSPPRSRRRRRRHGCIVFTLSPAGDGVGPACCGRENPSRRSFNGGGAAARSAGAGAGSVFI